MSGFVGILNLDGAPVDRDLLERLTRSLTFRGPDGNGIWLEGAVGLGHTLLQTTRIGSSQMPSGGDGDKQPASLDNRLWIVADVRLDARPELIEKLKKQSDNASGISPSTPDADLILQAYSAWGDACVDHLLGDFSFAIWDSTRQRLFCARDQMGVKPFFYAHLGSLVVFSNTLECVRRHPAVSRKLNDLGIADFLLFEMNQDPATTTFADVNRLPAAHILECDRNSFSVRRYWTLSVLEPIIFKHEHEYIERFLELLDQAVVDRMPADNAGIMLSGGLDSSTIAASARRVVTKFDNKTELFAYTSVLNNLIPDKEGHFASLVAKKLDIPVVLQALDEYRLFDRAGEPECLQSEPENSAWPGNYVDQLREISKKSKVALNGQGSDPGFASRITVHFAQLFKQRRYFQALTDATEYLGAKGRFSRLYLRGRWGILTSNQNPFYAFPGWLNKDFEKKLGLRDRWMTYEVSSWDAIKRQESTVSGFRPEAVMVMSDVGWQKTFEEFDPGVTRIPVEVRYPFFDLRLIDFLLRLQRLPWCCDKEMLRRAGRGVLPELVRLRPKSPLRHDPTLAVLEKAESAWVDRFETIPDLDRYIDRTKVPPVYMEKIPGKAWLNLRPLSLKFWLQGIDGLWFNTDQ